MKSLSTLAKQHKTAMQLQKQVEVDGVRSHNEIDYYRYKREYELISKHNPETISSVSLKLSKLLKFEKEEIAMMIECMIKDEWTLERANDAILNVMKTNIYSKKSIGHGNILSWERNYVFYTYEDVQRLVHENKTSFNELETVKIEGIINLGDDGQEKPFWAKKGQNPFQSWNEYLSITAGAVS